MKKNIVPVFIVSVFLVCGAAMAGPIDNAGQFQKKEVREAVKGIPGASSKPKPVIEGQLAEGQPVEGQPAEGQPAEEEKIKIEVSEKEIDTRVPSLKKNLKDIIRDADANIKRIDDQLKAEDSERSAKEHYDKGNVLYGEGKFEDAGKEWNSALGLAKDTEFRKRIRGSLKRAARQIRQAKEKREAEEWEKKKAELSGTKEDRRENVK